ncbi:STAS domain-containing protein [Treponema zuelzerae]|uniref:STAS domain-containing protein n=1 Tax=Teretinema zuelzerae TaxID=156 RepID=A0AAE3EFL7_9SPIR|nr:STAS domain-containing protein [Teretinema zuelzerae]MBN2811755.1 STAS domain-containing protein [Spirochaetales bacterium]MCD1653945.1 STAS domain-containing protein [Teretinema zuelzerae]
MENISIIEKSGSNYNLLEVAGTINSYTYTEFQNKVYDLVKKTNLVLDLSRVTNLSSSGLGVLMAALEDGNEVGNKLYVMKPSEVVRLAIESTGFSEMFTVIYSLTEVM